jgi:hypothetical protein
MYERMHKWLEVEQTKRIKQGKYKTREKALQ